MLHMVLGSMDILSRKIQKSILNQGIQAAVPAGCSPNMMMRGRQFGDGDFVKKADVIARTPGTESEAPSLLSAFDYSIADIFKVIKPAGNGTCADRGRLCKRNNVAGFSGNMYNESELGKQEREMVRSSIMRKYNTALPARGYVHAYNHTYIFAGKNGDATIIRKLEEAAAAQLDHRVRRAFNGQESNRRYDTFGSWIGDTKSDRGRFSSDSRHLGNPGERQADDRQAVPNGQGAQPGRTSDDGRTRQKILNGKYAELFEGAGIS